MRIYDSHKVAASLIRLMFLFCTAANAQDSALWGAWSDHVMGLLNPNNNPQAAELAHIVASPIPLFWDNPDYGESELCQFANRVPRPELTYAPSELEVYDEYKIFVTSIEPSGPRYDTNAIAELHRAIDPSYVKRVKGKDGTQQQCPEFSYEPGFPQLKNRSLDVRWEFMKERRVDTELKHRVVVKSGWFVYKSIGGQISTVEIDSVESMILNYGLGRILVRPGPWFSEDLVKSFGDGPFKPGSLLKERNLSGTSTPFLRRPGEAVVGLRPKIQLKFNPAMYYKLKENAEKSPVIDVGPFRFVVASPGVKVTWEDTDHILVLESNVPTPFLLAVINRETRVN